MTWTGSDHGEGVTELPYGKKRNQCSVDAVAVEIELGRIIREWSDGAKSSDWQAFGSLCTCSSARVFGLFGLRENEGFYRKYFFQFLFWWSGHIYHWCYCFVLMKIWHYDLEWKGVKILDRRIKALFGKKSVGLGEMIMPLWRVIKKKKKKNKQNWVLLI